MSVKKVKSKTGEVKWEVRIHLAGRGSKRLRRRFDRKVDADEFLNRERIKVQQEGLSGNASSYLRQTTFADEAEYWLQNRGPTISPGHLKRATGVLAEILPTLGSIKPARFDSRLLTKIQSDQLATGIKPATVNRKLEIIKAILRYSFDRKRIPANPSAGFTKLEAVRQGINFWSRDEVSSFLEFTDQKYPKESTLRWVYTAYLLAANTAIRAGEVWGLQPQDIKTEGLIVVDRQFDRVTRSLRPPKGKRSRRVPCNSDLLVELLQLIERRDTKPQNLVFFTEAGAPICHETFIRYYFIRDVKASGLRRIRFHDLRHTAATLMIDSGVQVNVVKEICGHADVSTTMGYVHLLADSIKDVGKTFSLSPKKAPTPTRPQLQIIG
jgi:integrase